MNSDIQFRRDGDKVWICDANDSESGVSVPLNALVRFVMDIPVEEWGPIPCQEAPSTMRVMESFRQFVGGCREKEG
jgi:hypothetical protein